MSEEIYKNLTDGREFGHESVHLENYPVADEKLIDEDLSFKMDVTRKIIGLGRSIRSKINIKTRQPLPVVKVYFEKDEKKLAACRHFREVILEELNVKELLIAENLDDLVSYKIKPNLKLLGIKYGALLPKIKNSLEQESSSQVAIKVRNEKTVNLRVEGKQIELLCEEILVEVQSRVDYGIESDGEYTVGLSINFSKELAEEGFCRELIHQIQNLRKEADFKIENTIITSIVCSEKERETIKKYKDFIMKETLSKKLIFEFEDKMFVKELKVNDAIMKIGLKVVGSII
jgi:isoleucyl-tRNA synthetase